MNREDFDAFEAFLRSRNITLTVFLDAIADPPDGSLPPFLATSRPRYLNLLNIKPPPPTRIRILLLSATPNSDLASDSDTDWAGKPDNLRPGIFASDESGSDAVDDGAGDKESEEESDGKRGARSKRGRSKGKGKSPADGRREPKGKNKEVKKSKHVERNGRKRMDHDAEKKKANADNQVGLHIFET